MDPSGPHVVEQAEYAFSPVSSELWAIKDFVQGGVGVRWVVYFARHYAIDILSDWFPCSCLLIVPLQMSQGTCTSGPCLVNKSAQI